MNNLSKVKSIFRSPALASVFAWSEPVRWAVIGISLISVINALLSLAVTMVTKYLIDGATSGEYSA